MELSLIKLANGTLAPADEVSNDELAKVKTGAQLHGKFTRMRNAVMHRRYFALLNYAFDVWSEIAPRVEYKGEPVAPNFDVFRRNIAVLSGFYTPVFNLKGELRMEAKSISFASMDELEFTTLYSKTIDTILSRVLTDGRITEQALRDHVDRVLAFDR